MATEVLQSVDGAQADFAEIALPSRVTVHLEAADLLALTDVDGFELAAAPGAGEWLVLHHLSWEWVFGAGRYINCHPAVWYDGDADVERRVALVDFDEVVSRVGLGVLEAIVWPRTIAENKALVLYNGDAGAVVWTSTIVTSTLADGGSGYAIGDTGWIGTGEAQYEVDTVGGGGEVLTYHLIANSIGYDTASNPVATTVVTGIGDGLFTLNVTAVPAPDGDLYVTADYTVETLH